MAEKKKTETKNETKIKYAIRFFDINRNFYEMIFQSKEKRDSMFDKISKMQDQRLVSEGYITVNLNNIVTFIKVEQDNYEKI